MKEDISPLLIKRPSILSVFKKNLICVHLCLKNKYDTAPITYYPIYGTEHSKFVEFFHLQVSIGIPFIFHSLFHKQEQQKTCSSEVDLINHVLYFIVLKLSTYVPLDNTIYVFFYQYYIRFFDVHM